MIGQHVRGFCRTHESQYKLAMTSKNSALMQLLRVDRDALFVKQASSSSDIEMEVSVDGSHFKMNVQELLFE